jgi:GNAT superfamily N-acetyltransferase
MRHDPGAKIAPPGGDLVIARARMMPLHFYRYLYGTVGQEYNWVDRIRLDDRSLARIIHNADVELYVLYAEGSPAGYAELNFREYPDVELVHFGLIPEATGRGLGRYFLSEMIAHVWSRSPNRLHVQTCTLDHPAALGLYKDCGFVSFAEVVKNAEELA